VILVSFAEGTVKSTPGYERIRQMPFYHWLETGCKAGSKVERSVDLFTAVGSAILMHSDAEVLRKDVETIRQMETDCAIFEFGLAGGSLSEPEPENCL
jgi:hypothetical protein